MYSLCPRCQAIFNVSEPDVEAHHGLVRCGHCGSVFHAVTNEIGEHELPDRPGQPTRGGGEALSPPVERAVEPEDAPGAAEPEQHAESVESEHTPEPAADSPRSAAEYDDDSDDFEPELPPARDAVPERDEQPAPQPAPGPVDGERGEADEDAPADVDAHPEPPREPRSGEIEPALTGSPATSEDTGDGDTDYEAMVTEEILIEAPPVLWNAFDEEKEEDEPEEPPRQRDRSGAAQQQERARSGPVSRGASFLRFRRRAEAGQETPTPALEPASGPAEPRAPLQSPYQARDIRMVELPPYRPFKAVWLALAALALLLILAWQVKTFYLDDLAQLPFFRSSLERICGPLGCELPPRRDFARIDLVGTGIDVNPRVPGALEITASLINRAEFPQPYPLLRVTLTDREGRIVGQRTYPPSEYRPEAQRELLPVTEVREVSINLAQPAEQAVGYEVDLVPATDEGSE